MRRYEYGYCCISYDIGCFSARDYNGLTRLSGNRRPCDLVQGKLIRGRSGGAMVLDKLPGPGRPTSLDKSRARAYCTCSRCGWGLFGHFYSHLSFLFSVSLSLGDDPI